MITTKQMWRTGRRSNDRRVGHHGFAAINLSSRKEYPARSVFPNIVVDDLSELNVAP